MLTTLANEKENSNAINLLHIIKILKKAGNTFLYRAGLAKAKELKQNEVRFINDISYFPEQTNDRKTLRRYTEKNVFVF